MKRYLVWGLLAIGIHGWFFWIWEPKTQTIELALQTGKKAVSLQLVNNAPSSTHFDNNTAVKETIEEKSKEVTPKPPAQPNPPVVTQEKKIAQSKPQPISETKIKLSAPKQLSKSLPKKTHEQIASTQQHQSKTTTPKATQENLNYKAKTKVADNHSKQPNSSTTSQLSNSEPQGVLTVAKSRSSRTPKYPRRAIVRNQQGQVKVKLEVNSDGKANNIELLKSSGHKLLDKSVLSFVKREKFIPATRDGKVIASSQVFSFRFVLQ